MAEKKKAKQRKVEEEKPTKEEYAVAKYLRFGLPVREGKLHGMEVKCFFGNAAVDKLLASKWSASKNPTDSLFHNRVSCVSYLARLLEKGLFHRAEREKRKKDKDKDRSKRKKKDKGGEKEEIPAAEEEVRQRKGKKEKKSKKVKDSDVAAADDEVDKKAESEKKDEKKKKEKRLKLVMPDEQYFEDGDEVYVWIYDPVNAKNFLIGLLMVLGAIALCMFPLWPEEVRVGVYYLSLAAAGFVGFILSLVIVRLILFCLIWLLTFGKHHLWFLPNLTEDVGFFDSFRPLYKHDVISKSDDTKSGDGGKRKKKDKLEEETEAGVAVTKKEKSSDKDDSDEFELIKKEDLDQNGANEEDNDDEEGGDIENEYDNEEADKDLEGEDNIGDENGDTEEGEEEDEEDEDDEDESNSEPAQSPRKRETKKTK